MVDPFFRTNVAGVGVGDRVSYDAGLRAHMQRVFNYMAGGLAVTGLAAYIVAHTALAQLIYGSPLQIVVMLAPLAFLIFGMNFQNLSASSAQTRFWIFSTLMGLSLGWIFMAYTDVSVVRAFFVTSATFGAMSLWGYTTKKDLTNFGAFMMMGVLGIFIATCVNYLLSAFSSGPSPMMQWIVSVIGVVVFTGLTAYDVQNIKLTYAEGWGAEANNKSAIVGALHLYINFINAFQFLLSLMGDRR